MVTASLVAIAVVEGALRAVRVVPEYIVPDADLGWALKPGVSGWTNDEHVAWVAINRSGWFDREHALAKPPRTRRIAVLGDSFMSTFNLPFEKTFVAFLEDGLNRCPARSDRIEALNFGVPAYGTAQELLAYRLRARAYQPDVVLLMMYLGNDVLNNHSALNPTKGAPYYVLDDQRHLRRVAPAPPEPGTAPVDPATLPLHQQARLFVTRRSKAAALLYDSWARLRNGPPDVTAVDPWPEVVYRAPTTTVVTDAWRVTEALIKQLAVEVAADGAEFWLATLPTSAQVDPDPAARRATASHYDVESLTYADDRVRDFARANGIRTISLLQPLAEYSERHATNLYGGYTSAVPAGHGHWNETGNRVAAEAVSEYLCPQTRAIRP